MHAYHNFWSRDGTICLTSIPGNFLFKLVSAHWYQPPGVKRTFGFGLDSNTGVGSSSETIMSSTTFNMDPSKIEEKITNKTKALIVVSLYGQTPDFDTINKIATKYNLPVIEDGAQSFGAMYNGKKSCNLVNSTVLNSR